MSLQSQPRAMQCPLRVIVVSALWLAVSIQPGAVPGFARAQLQSQAPATRPTAQQRAPPAAPATGAITGVVVDGTSGAAVAGAVVSLRAPAGIDIGPQPSQLADDKGRFAFVNLPASPGYTIAASKFGYLSGGYGRDTEPSDPLRLIPLKENEWVGNLRVPIWKPGSIGGTVRDENGEPVVGVFVRALMRYRLQGRDELAVGPMTVTDDRGAYRMAGLTPGRYVIQVPSVQASMSAGTAAPPPQARHDGILEMDDTSRLVIGRYPLPPPMSGGRPMAYPIAFHPAASVVSQATTIDLTYGDDRANVDVALTPMPAVRVSGAVDAPPEALSLLTLRLLPAGLENLGHGSEAATALVGSNGQFTFLNVPAGSYTIDAPVKISEFLGSQSSSRGVSFPPPPGIGGWGVSSEAPDPVTGLQFSSTNFRSRANSYSARLPLTVGGSDVTGVVVRLRSHLTMTVRFVFENDLARPAAVIPPWLRTSLDPAGGEAYLGRPAGSFDKVTNEMAIPGVMPGQYWIRLTGNAAWVLKSVSWKGRDYTTMPIDTTSADDLGGVVVTVTNAVPELSGSVRVTGDMKPDQALVIVFPVDQTLWRNVGLWPARLKSAPVSNAGTYRFANLPAGTYFVAAIDRGRRATWIDPDVLAQVARTATPVTLMWGGTTSQDVSLTAVRK